MTIHLTAIINIEQYFPVVLVKVILNFVSVDEIFNYHYSPKSY